MEQFGGYATKSQYTLLNNMNIRRLRKSCIQRGIYTEGITKKYDLIVLFIQWFNNIKYYQNNLIHGYVVCEKGIRKHMEDSFIINVQGNTSIYGVFDGHGGNYISSRLREYCMRYLMTEIIGSKLNKHNIYNSFLNIDRQFYEIWKKNLFGTDGSTSSFVIQRKNILYFVNLGDSRTVLYGDNGTYFSTRDHKPSVASEFERIENTKYNVIMKDVGRIGGFLAVSRSFGDYVYKLDNDDKYRPTDYAVSTVPEIDIIDINKINSKNKLIISATDGLWDVFSNSQVFQYIQNSKNKGLGYKSILKNLVNLAYERGSTDNITIVMVEL